MASWPPLSHKIFINKPNLVYHPSLYRQYSIFIIERQYSSYTILVLSEIMLNNTIRKSIISALLCTHNTSFVCSITQFSLNNVCSFELTHVVVHMCHAYNHENSVAMILTVTVILTIVRCETGIV